MSFKSSTILGLLVKLYKSTYIMIIIFLSYLVILITSILFARPINAAAYQSVSRYFANGAEVSLQWDGINGFEGIYFKALTDQKATLIIDGLPFNFNSAPRPEILRPMLEKRIRTRAVENLGGHRRAYLISLYREKTEFLILVNDQGQIFDLDIDTDSGALKRRKSGSTIYEVRSIMVADQPYLLVKFIRRAARHNGPLYLVKTDGSSSLLASDFETVIKVRVVVNAIVINDSNPIPVDSTRFVPPKALPLINMDQFFQRAWQQKPRPPASKRTGSPAIIPIQPAPTGNGCSGSGCGSGGSKKPRPLPVVTIPKPQGPYPVPRYLIPRTDDVRIVRDKQGEEIDPIEFVEEKFPNLTERLGKDSRAVELLESDRDSILQIRKTLTRNENGNILIVGDSGVGKTKLAHAFVKKVARGEIPEIPANTPVYLITPSALSAGASYVGEFETRVQALLESLKMKPAILFVDNLHSMRGTGTSEGKTSDFFDLIVPSLLDGSIRIIGTSSYDQWNAAVEGNQSLRDAFQLVTKAAPNQGETISIMDAWAVESQYPSLPRNVLERIIELSNRFRADGNQPRKAIDLLQEVYAEDRFSNSPNPSNIDESFVDRVAVRILHIPILELDPVRRAEKLSELPEQLDAKIIGHSNVKRAIVTHTQIAYAGLHHDKPKMTLILAGLKGQAKTTIAGTYAEIMELPFVRIDLTEVSSKEELYGQMSRALRKNAHTVFLLDEFEKAELYLRNALLRVTDSGKFSISEGLNTKGGATTTMIDATNATLFIATNAGSNYLEGHRGSSFNPDDFSQKLRADGLSEFLVDRADEILPVWAPDQDDFRRIIELHFDREIERIRSQYPKLTIDLRDRDAIIDAYAEAFFVDNTSPREVLQTIKKDLLVDTATHVINLHLTPNACVTLQARRLPNRTGRSTIGFSQI